MKPRSIGVRLAFWYMGLLAATIVILGASAYVLLTYSLQHELDNALQSVANALADRYVEGIEPSRSDSVEQLFRQFFGFVPLNPYYEMLDPVERRPLLSNQKRRLPLSDAAWRNASRGIATFETINQAERYPIRILTRPVIINSRVVNLVQVGMSLERTYRTSKNFLLILTTMLPVGIALAGIGGWLLARRALRPVQVMTQAARRISAFHLSERVKESGTGDELDQLARTLNETLERLDASFIQMRQFSADASHELQTPLTVLKGEIEVALRSHREAGEYKVTLESALEEINRMAKLVEGLLFLARADSGVLKIDRQSVEIRDLVHDVQAEMSKTAVEGRVELICENTEPARVVGDPVLLRQLIQNLVHNGLKYTPEGGRVEVQTALADGWATIAVSDNGEGIDPDEKDKIFQRFYRSARAKSQSDGSSGLGLSIVESIVKAHKGKIEVTSKLGSGTTFKVSLPISQ